MANSEHGRLAIAALEAWSNLREAVSREYGIPASDAPALLKAQRESRLLLRRAWLAEAEFWASHSGPSSAAAVRARANAQAGHETT